MQISQSWEDLTLEAEGLTFKESESPTQQLNKSEKQITKRVFDPLNLNLSSGGPPLCSSPSPTRSGLGQRQCYSPGIHMVNWKNSLSPSPTRKAFATRWNFIHFFSSYQDFLLYVNFFFYYKFFFKEKFSFLLKFSSQILINSFFFNFFICNAF